MTSEQPISVPYSRKAAVTAARFAEATRLSLVSVDSLGRIEFVNAAACALFGYERHELIGQPITIIVPERMRGAHMTGLAKVAEGNKPNLGGKTVEVFALKKDGSEFPIEITLSIWKGSDGVAAGAVIKDISERRERDSRLLRLASQDSLTGLHNRYRFTTLLNDVIGAAEPATVILLDLDGFKEVNDTHGHAVGDCLLQAVGVRLQYHLGETAEVARFGGDEFAVLLCGVGDPLVAHREARALLGAFQTPFDVGGHVLDLGASLGYALFPSHATDADELIASADFALYRAKAEGGRVLRLYDASMRSAAAAQRAMRDELRIALREGQLELYYQPQIDLTNGRLIGLEALIRWRHPERGLLLPSAFLPALEQNTLALEIGSWTLDTAARTAGALRRSGHDIMVSVNLFPVQLRSPHLAEKVRETIALHGITPSMLELEVTETIALEDNDRSLEAMNPLREIGVGIAFDDFGTGFASLSSLQRYPITTLKIDRAFVKDILTRPGDAAITRALISLSREMGIKTIAEGVETAEQEEKLLALGCPCAQGYRYGRPMPFADVVRQLASPHAPMALNKAG